MKSIMRPVTAIRLFGALVAWLGPAEGRAQARVTIAAQAIGVFHRVDPTAEARAASGVQLIQPVIMVILGGVVLFIILAVILPYISVLSSLGSPG